MIDPDALDLIMRFEGLGDGDKVTPGLQPYICPAGVWTLGYGATYGPSGSRVTGKTRAISVKKAEELLERDVGRFGRSVDRMVRVPVSALQRGALVSFAFNLGAGALFSSTLLRHLNAFEWDDIPYQFARWTMAGGRVLAGLVRRRRAEGDLWVRGLF